MKSKQITKTQMTDGKTETRHKYLQFVCVCVWRNNMQKSMYIQSMKSITFSPVCLVSCMSIETQSMCVSLLLLFFFIIIFFFAAAAATTAAVVVRHLILSNLLAKNR